VAISVERSIELTVPRHAAPRRGRPEFHKGSGTSAAVVTATGSATRCRPDESLIRGADMAIRVLCRSAAGQVIDSAFIAQFVW